MSEFQFNSEQRHFPINGAAHRSSPFRVPINYRLWIVELIYVYPLGKEMILDEFKEQKTFRTSYRQWVAAKEEQALVTFHEAGFYQDLYWIKINHDSERKGYSIFRRDSGRLLIFLEPGFCQRPCRYSSGGTSRDA